MAKPHWTQTPAGKIKMSAAQKKVWSKREDRSEYFRQLARLKAKTKRKYTKRENKSTSLVVNGWRITLSKNEIRIEHE